MKQPRVSYSHIMENYDCIVSVKINKFMYLFIYFLAEAVVIGKKSEYGVAFFFFCLDSS